MNENQHEINMPAGSMAGGGVGALSGAALAMLMNKLQANKVPMGFQKFRTLALPALGGLAGGFVGGLPAANQKEASMAPLLAAGLGGLIGGKALNGLTPIGLKNRSALFSVIPTLLGAGAGAAAGVYGGSKLEDKMKGINIGDQLQKELADLQMKTAPKGIYGTDRGIVVNVR